MHSKRVEPGRLAELTKAFAVFAITTREDSSLVEIADVVVAIPATPSRQFGGSLFEQASLVLLDALIFDLTRGDPCVYEVMSQRYTNLE